MLDVSTTGETGLMGRVSCLVGFSTGSGSSAFGLSAATLMPALRAATCVSAFDHELSRMFRMAAFRELEEEPPSTTARSLLSQRRAVAIRLKPDADVKPVFMPSIPW